LGRRWGGMVWKVQVRETIKRRPNSKQTGKREQKETMRGGNYLSRVSWGTIFPRKREGKGEKRATPTT